ncbi:MAG: ATP-binding protein [Microthrixaceae bacterium]
MTLRLKLVLALVALSATATAAIGLVSYRTTASQLTTQIDRSLEATTDELRDGPPGRGDLDRPGLPRPRAFRAEGDVVVQLVTSDGEAIATSSVELPVDRVDRRLAAAQRPLAVARDVQVDGESFRMLTTADGEGAVQAARSLAETDRVLTGLRSDILAAALVVILVAAALGWVIARQITRRLERLTAAAEEVATTRRLEVQVPVSGSDETGRLGVAFNEMLAALARSKQDQQRLVQDAGHELRTPLTSLRTNVFTLRRARQLTDDQREQVLDDLESESEELTRLVNEVVELATDRRDDEPVQEVLLGPLVERVATRAAQRSGRQVQVAVDDTVVLGRPLALERAVNNLVENALKFDPEGPVSVTCDGGRVEVADHGPGIQDEDLPRIFDRFYRSADARSRPGSGLGLAIVATVVDQHGGQVSAANRPDGGATVGFTLPTSAPRTSSPDPHLG